MTSKQPLTDRDIEKLADCFIDRDAIDQAGLYRVDSAEGARIVGRTAGSTDDYSGIVFPYFQPGDQRVREVRLRRDNPDFELVDGVTKEKRKYLSPPGRSNMLYFPPQCNREWLKDTSIPIVITEGEKKTIALNRVAWHGLGDAAEIPRFISIGLSGVWNFRGRIGKTTASDGSRRDIKGLITDFELIELEDRQVAILFDANAQSNDSVFQARRTLAAELSRRNAEVNIAELPKIEGINGIDDLLGSWEKTEGKDSAVESCLALIKSGSVYRQKVKKSDQLLQLADHVELFHTPENEPFASVLNGDHYETIRLNSKAFRHWISFQHFAQNGSSPSVQAIQDAINALSGKAIFDGPVSDVHLRIAEHKGSIYLDLCNDNWEVVEIKRSGWKIIPGKCSPVKFRRTKGMLPLLRPIGSGNIDKLGSYLNLSRENLTLVLCWLVNCFRPGYPFPILLLSGEQGTAKSTSSRVLRSLIDPSTIPVRSTPRDERDLILAASNGWVVGLDNLSTIPEWLSDALCRLSTGGGFGTRTLYTDDEETIFNAKRPIIINGIGDIASRSDLLDRALTVRLEPIPKSKRRTENDFWSAFGEDAREIFVGLINAVSIALSNIDTVTLDQLPRMADFARFATAAETGLGLAKGSFLDVYDRNRQDVHLIVLEDSPLAETVQEYCAARAIDGTFVNESLLLKELLEDLKRIAGDRFSNDKRFPKSPKGLRSGLERINPNLREIGISIKFHGRVGRNAAKGASLSIEYRRQETSQTSNNQSPEAPQGNFPLPDDVEILREIGLRHWTTAMGGDAKHNDHSYLPPVDDVGDVSDGSFQDDSPW